jgi:HlyD family secretion protein
MKKLLIALGAVVVVGGGAAMALSSKDEAGQLVRTEAVARRDLVSTVTASGKIEPKRRVEISADISGRVVQVAVEEGQWVNQGDLLLRLDPTQLQAAVRRAEATVAQSQARAAQARAQQLKAESDLRRNEMLARTNELISAADVEQSRTQAAVAVQEANGARFAVNQAQAALSEARDQLSKTTIRAPMSGRVTRLNIEQGETAVVGTMNNPGSLLLTIADLSVMEAKVQVDETDIPGLNVGDSASVKVDAFPGQSFPGTVTRIGNSSIQVAGAGGSSEQQSVDYEVVITLSNPPAELRPDLSATAEIVTDRRPGALSVPIIALTVRDREGKKFTAAGEGDEKAPGASEERRDEDEVEGVFVMREGKAVWVPVKIGISGDRYFEVVTGLKGGETVVAGSYAAIRELQAGDALRVEAPAAEAGKGKAKAAEGRKG